LSRADLRYWVLPDGRAVSWSVVELAEKKDDELVTPNAFEAYVAMGQELAYEPLGMLPDAERGPQFCPLEHIDLFIPVAWIKSVYLYEHVASEVGSVPRQARNFGGATVEEV